MTNMFTNYDNIKSTSCFAAPLFDLPKGIKSIKNIKGEILGVQAEQALPLQLYFHLENVCEEELLEIISGTVLFEIITTTHKTMMSKEFLVSNILDQASRDLSIRLSPEELKPLKKETYTMRVTLKVAETSYVIFDEKDSYLVIR